MKFYWRSTPLYIRYFVTFLVVMSDPWLTPVRIASFNCQDSRSPLFLAVMLGIFIAVFRVLVLWVRSQHLSDMCSLLNTVSYKIVWFIAEQFECVVLSAFSRILQTRDYAFHDNSPFVYCISCCYWIKWYGLLFRWSCLTFCYYF